MAVLRIIRRLPCSISVHVSLPPGSDYGAFTKHQPSIIQPPCATVYVGYGAELTREVGVSACTGAVL